MLLIRNQSRMNADVVEFLLSIVNDLVFCGINVFILR